MQKRFGEVVGVRNQVARRLRAVDHALVEALSQSREMIRVEVRKEVGVGPRSAEIVLLEERVLSIKKEGTKRTLIENCSLKGSSCFAFFPFTATGGSSAI